MWFFISKPIRVSAQRMRQIKTNGRMLGAIVCFAAAAYAVIEVIKAVV